MQKVYSCWHIVLKLCIKKNRKINTDTFKSLTQSKMILSILEFMKGLPKARAEFSTLLTVI